jgi:hypothetical protein
MVYERSKCNIKTNPYIVNAQTNPFICESVAPKTLIIRRWLNVLSFGFFGRNWSEFERCKFGQNLYFLLFKLSF